MSLGIPVSQAVCCALGEPKQKTVLNYNFVGTKLNTLEIKKQAITW